MNRQIKTAVCPVCHGTGCIGTTDWLTRGIDKEKLAKAREEALAEYEAQKKRGAAREIFDEVDGITDLFAKGIIGELEMYDMLADLRKKYESEGKE